MGNEVRAERMASQFTGWKYKVAKRVLKGCGNCKMRSVCGANILKAGGYEKNPLMVVERVMTSSLPETMPGEPTPLAKDLASFMKNNCATCDKFVACIGNFYYISRGHALGLEREVALSKRWLEAINDSLLPNRIEIILLTLNLDEDKLKRAALKAFLACNTPFLKIKEK
jgi:hypothetical protein